MIAFDINITTSSKCRFIGDYIVDGAPTCIRPAWKSGILNVEPAVCCVKRLTLPWWGCENTVALKVQRSWEIETERERMRGSRTHVRNIPVTGQRER
ncbi:hypothetical protein EVAR_25401_1 [Eumeta japonica]|uniref:Uncharacterized protein n=1 Tax=Eumeta variegata TaxID=151549 RepID=A0A4C1V5L2_EUMVA|nr:hypothetical protein EVAR_25401_1 [Eumeta japonica]